MSDLYLIGTAPRRRRRTKAQREAISRAKRIREADARIDGDLSRALDAILFLSRNEVDAAPLIARISAMEAETVTANLIKAVEWLNRFADSWHVFIGDFEAEGTPSATSIE